MVAINGVLIGSTMATSSGAWTFDDTATALPDGTYAITAAAMDVAGNLSGSSSTFTATIETVAPPAIVGVKLTSGSLGLSRGQQALSVLGTAAPGNRVQLFLNGTVLGSLTASAQGAWTYVYSPTSSSVPAGKYKFSALATDTAGNTSVMSPTFTLEVGGGPTAGTPQYASGVLSGQATPGSLISIVDGNVVIGIVTADASGNWQFTPTLSQGKHTIMVDATDGYGDTSVLSTAITVSA
jgi:hypothetical protein